MQFKHYFGIRRPADRSTLVEPMLLTPSHGSYPAGHSTQAHFAAEVLKKVIGIPVGSEKETVLTNLADRIGENRVVAGVHFQDDIDQGAVLGARLAKYFIHKSTVANSALNWLWTEATGEQWS
jgi:hypothetical protein